MRLIEGFPCRQQQIAVLLTSPNQQKAMIESLNAELTTAMKQLNGYQEQVLTLTMQNRQLSDLTSRQSSLIDSQNKHLQSLLNRLEQSEN